MIARGAEALERAIRTPPGGGPALAAYLTAGFPTMDGFSALASRVAAQVDVLEIGVPFSDPMADGVTIQETSRQALAQGVTLQWILDLVSELQSPVPVVLMSYLNPLLARGLERLARDGAEAGVSGFIVPDLPLDESAPLRSALSERGLALVQLVTPLTPTDRTARIARATGGFLYAVTRTGTTGGGGDGLLPHIEPWLADLRSRSPVPVMAGFGIRDAAQVRRLAAVVDGVIVGSALLECIADGEAPEPFLRGLRQEMPPE